MFSLRMVLNSFVLVAAMLCIFVISAKANTIYIPHVGTHRAVVDPKYPAISQFDCPDGFVVSKSYPNGTTASYIYKDLQIHPQDLMGIPINRERLSEGFISSITQESPICWLGDKYPTVFLEDVDLVAEPLNLYFPEGRHTYLTPQLLAQTAQGACTTLSVVFTTAEGFWQGAQIVGLLRRGVETVGKLVCNIASIPQGIWSNTAYVYPIAVAATQIYAASTEGVVVPPTLLNEDGTAAVFYYAVDIETMYVKCFMDAILEADRMQVPTIRRLYLFGYEDAGCILASKPFFDGQRALSLKNLNENMLLFSGYVEVKNNTFTPEEIEELLQALEEDLAKESKSDDPGYPDVYWVPARNLYECPTIPIDVYVQAAVNESNVYIEQIVREGITPRSEMLHLIKFATDSREIISFDFVATYATNRPWKSGTRARLVSENVDVAGNKWAVDLICYDTSYGYIWIGLETGRTYAGLLRSDRDNVDPYQYR